MDRKNTRAYLQDMLDNASFVKSYMADKTSDQLLQETDIRFVVERGLQNVGEAAYQLRRTEPAILELITESGRMISMRHVLVHGYDEVRPAVLWNVVQTKLDILISEVSALLKHRQERDQ